MTPLFRTLDHFSTAPINDIGSYDPAWLEGNELLHAGTGAERPVFIASLYDAAMVVNKGCFVEIGVKMAQSTQTTLTVLNQIGLRRMTLYSIDADCKKAAYGEVVKRCAGKVRTKLVSFLSQSNKAQKAVRGVIRWIFIDGCHCFDCALDDIELWAPRVAPHGIMIIHDTSLYGRWNRLYKCFRSGNQMRRTCTWPAVMASLQLRYNFDLIRIIEGPGTLREGFCGLRVYRKKPELDPHWLKLQDELAEREKDRHATYLRRRALNRARRRARRLEAKRCQPETTS